MASSALRKFGFGLGYGFATGAFDAKRRLASVASKLLAFSKSQLATKLGHTVDNAVCEA